MSKKYKADGKNLRFNSKKPAIMHIDLNSCFATIEQQANPHLRGKPVAVAAYSTPSGCIIAPSIEAKEFGIKTGMRVKDGKLLCPKLIILEPDPDKYRNVHLLLKNLLLNYTHDVYPKSIDEFVLNLDGYPILRTMDIKDVAKDIKNKIKKQIGEYLTVSVGISTNRFLAKVASDFQKPDGLTKITKENFLYFYSVLELEDLYGIKTANAARLKSVGIHSVSDLYFSSLGKLKMAFQSINAYYWYLRIRGWEIDDVEFSRKSFGNSYALPKPFSSGKELSPILSKLVSKASYRLRRAGYKTKGVHLAILYRDGNFWHKGVSFNKALFDTREIYKKAYRILRLSPFKKPVRELAVSCYKLVDEKSSQLELFEDIEKNEKITRAMDFANERWGQFVVTPARMLSAKEDVPDRIAFGAAGPEDPLALRGVKELEEYTLGKSV